MFVLLLLIGCVPPEETAIQHKGLIDCFRLDREPVTDQGCGNDLGEGNLARPNKGNYHRNLDQPMTSNVLIKNMPQAHMDKLPVSDCLWTAGSQFGNGDRVVFYWDSWFEINFPDTPELGSSLNSACRFDPPFNRISKFEEVGENGNNHQCFHTLDFDAEELIDLQKIKSTCDVDVYGIPLVEHTKSDNIYGQCLGFNEVELNTVIGARVGVDVDRMLTGYRSDLKQVSGCAHIEEEGLISIIPSVDAIFSVGDLTIPNTSTPIPGTRSLLYPQIMTVIGQRNIARPLQAITSNQFIWQAGILISGEAGNQKWLENFSENIRVDKVRMFKVIDQANDVREYINLNGSTLNVFDADDEIPGVANSCPSDDGSDFDVTGCQFNATPTYQINHLVDTNINTLSDPLTWQIELSSEVVGDMYIEFDLVSVNKTSEAAILADPAFLDLGDTLVGESSSEIIKVTNVGNGPYMIDDVFIDPVYGQPHAFDAERLDDPVMIPYPIYLESTGNDDVYQIGFQDMSHIETQMDIREFEVHSTVRKRHKENIEIEVESESVMLQGRVAVAQSPNPSFDGSLRMADRIYPFRYSVYQTWGLPYLLKAGEQRSIMVSSNPPHVGDFKGQVSVSGYPFHDPNARTTASVFLNSYGSTGARVEILPKSLMFPHLNGSSNELNVVVGNVGDATLIRSDIHIYDSNHSQHAGEALNFEILGNNATLHHIQQGDSERILIKYDPGCFPQLPVSGYHRAVLSISTDKGDYVVPLVGDPLRYVDGHSACQPGG